MTRRPRDDDMPATKGDLRSLAKQLDDIAGSADSAAAEASHTLEIEREVRELRERFEAVVDYMLDYMDWQESTSAEGNAEQRVDRYARAYLDNREPDGTPPTQARLAEVLYTTDRTLRYVGWDRIRARATEIEGGATNRND